MEECRAAYATPPMGRYTQKNYGLQAILVILNYLCYYCNGFPARPERMLAVTMCVGKKTGILMDSLKQPVDPLPCRVETYSGARLHDHPRRFTLKGEWLEVVRIFDRWREPEFLSFLVVASDSHPYSLKYQLHQDAWQVVIWRGSSPVAV